MLLYRFLPLSQWPHEERLLSAAEDPRSAGEFGRCWSFFSCLDLKSGFWQIKMDESSKQYTTFTVGNLGFFECDHMPFGLCNAPATFQWLIQNCLRELNLIYYLIYLDDIVILSQTSWGTPPLIVQVVSDWFREHNLRLKPSKCNLFREEITCLAHWVSKDGVQPSNSNLTAIAECACFLKHTQRYVLFLVWWATIGSSSKGLHSHCTATQQTAGWRRGQQEVRAGVTFGKMPVKAFEALKEACMTAPTFGFHWLH